MLVILCVYIVKYLLSFLCVPPTCDSKFLGADADLLFICGEQNSLSICTPHLKPLTLSLYHFWTWESGRKREGHRVKIYSKETFKSHKTPGRCFYPKLLTEPPVHGRLVLNDHSGIWTLNPSISKCCLLHTSAISVEILGPLIWSTLLGYVISREIY